MKKTIIDISATEARKIFLKSEWYSNIDLPEYFDFTDLLNKLNKKMSEIQDVDLDNLICPHKTILCGPRQFYMNKKGDFEIEKTNLPSNIEQVNYSFYHNKDGNLAWRKMQLINPALYILLVHIITEDNNWNIITQRFKEFYKNNIPSEKEIMCCSIPPIRDSNTTLAAETITNWWTDAELEALVSSMSFKWLATTDLTDCYGSLYTHTIPWAIKGQEYSKNNRSKKLFENKIDSVIQSMNFGQTNGIPQGSVLMDFIAELVLGYSDLLLSEKLKKRTDIQRYKIIRYRDDYRIFTDSKEDAVKILRDLSEVSAVLNFKLNMQKTFVSQELIADSIKPDKLYYNSEKKMESTLHNHLLLIHKLAKEHINSGSLKKALQKFRKRVISECSIAKDIDGKLLRVLIAILVDIAMHNSNAYSQIVCTIGNLLSFESDKDKQNELFSVIKRKFEDIPNSCFLSVWMQRLAITNKNLEYGKSNEPLCNVVESIGKTGSELWEFEWLKDEYKMLIKSTSIISEKKYKNMPEYPDENEGNVFIGY